MAAVLRNGAIVDDSWLPPAVGGPAAGERRMLTLAQWLAGGGGAAVQLEPEDGCDAVLPAIAELQLVAVHFPVFTDGRGFSYARRLREAGFGGELRARGDFLADQAHYLRRCGFDTLEFSDPAQLETALTRLRVFSEEYQAAVDQPLPLFRRRA